MKGKNISMLKCTLSWRTLLESCRDLIWGARIHTNNLHVFHAKCLGRVFDNRVLGKIIFGPKRDEVTGQWRIIKNYWMYDLYSPPIIIWLIK